MFRFARRALVAAPAALAAMLLAATAGAADLYTVTDLGTLGGTRGSGAYSLNGHGQAVGYSFVPGSTYVHAMVNSYGAVTDLGTLGGTQSLARSVNSLGHVVGWAYPPGQTLQHAFLWKDGVMTDLGTFGGQSSDADEINDDDLVVGSAFDSLGRERAFWWKDGAMHDLGTLGGSQSRAYSVDKWGDVVGRALTDGDVTYHPFLGKPGGPLYDLGTLGGFTGDAYAVNDLAHVVGWSQLPGNGTQSAGFFFADGTMKSIGTLGNGFYSAGFGINDNDVVVGQTTRADGVTLACLWQNDQLVDLNSLLVPGSGWVLTSANDIDDQGAIVGEGVHNGHARGFLLTPSSTLGVNGWPPAEVRFAGARPNPVRDGALLGFDLPAAAHVTLAIYDVRGRRRCALADGDYGAGHAEVAWNARDGAGTPLPPGAYWARLVVNGRAFSRALVVLH